MQEEQFIPGIFNYCDHWCERCSMTAKCHLFADEQEANRADPDSEDPDKEQFWYRVRSNLQRTRKLLEEYLEEEGVTHTPEQLEQMAWRGKDIDERVEAHPLNKAAQEYAMEVHHWFGGRTELFDSVQADLESAARLELPGVDPEEEQRRINEAVEVIQWYHIQIAAKINRALFSRMEDEGDDQMAEFPSDADGSAKVALMGIDNSLASWGGLRDCFDDGAPATREDSEADVIFDIMVNLDRIRRGVELEFPQARAFVRPGFDE